MDIEATRDNERVKSIASMCDNAALALYIAAVIRLFQHSDLYVLINVISAIILMWIAWHIRGLLQSEA